MSFKKLLKNITTSGSWVQLDEEIGAAAYSPGAGLQAQIGNWSAKNLHATNNVQVELAIYATAGSYADAKLLGKSETMESGDQFGDDDARDLIHAGYGLFARVTGTSPNVTVRATIKEATA